jgi:hypothetical protein
MGPDGVVVLTPGLDRCDCLSPGAEPFHAQALVSAEYPDLLFVVALAAILAAGNRREKELPRC